ncbi:dihydrofolate reductase family protein [Lentzea indica]|uniref:dihydrofolate reductase family protein n=1 Tax=Lentzea indica TaxID=2604800 RepID=UPI001CB721AF|nr:dihydrofolate reductase family protein [Lentzea indica]
MIRLGTALGCRAHGQLAAVGLSRSLMRLDLIDELQVSLFPYVAGEGTRMFDGIPKAYQLDLVSSAASRNGIVELQYRRHR